MPIVTLTTDFGYKDYSVSVIKGALIQQISDVTIIDISTKSALIIHQKQLIF